MAIKVIEHRFPEFEKEITKLNHKAKKYGFDPISYTVSGEKFKKLPETGHTVKFLLVDVDGEIPFVKGWKVVATLDHTHPITLARVMGDYDVHEFKDRKPVCDHCHTHRIKVKSYVIANEDGDMMQVGTGCIKDYIDRSVEFALAKFGFLSDAYDGEWERIEGGGKPSYYFELDEVIKAAYYSIRDRGFKPAHDDFSTALDVAYYFEPPVSLANEYKWTFGEKEEAFVDEFMEYYGNIEVSNNFVMMVKDIIKLGYVTPRYISYIAGAANTVFKEIQKEKSGSVEYADSWVGDVKKRMEFDVVVERVIPSDGYYGMTYITHFRTKDNHKLVWFATSKNLEDEVGNSLKIKGTVKKHDEYNGVKQTVITRVTVL